MANHDLSTALTLLSAMITPAVLILACASLAISTSARLGRVVDRTRKLSERILTQVRSRKEGENAGERAELLRQLGMTARRARLLQLALTCLYLALAGFVAASFALGVVAMLEELDAWLPIVLGLAGIVLLFMASLLLIADGRIAIAAIDAEMKAMLRLCRECADITGEAGE